MSDAKDPLKNLKKMKAEVLSCVHCGQCRVATWPSKGIYRICPVYDTECTPKFEPFFARGKHLVMEGLLSGNLQLSKEISDMMFQCTLCGACEDFCHNSHNPSINFANHQWMGHVKAFEAARADLVEAGYAIDAQAQMNAALAEKSNPYGQDNADKQAWAQKLEFKIKDASKERAEVLYFAGCTSTLSRVTQNIAINTAKILNKLGVDFAVFLGREICCGSVALRTGDKKVFDAISQRNIDLFGERRIMKIVTSCAGCYRAFKKDYGTRLARVEILHTVEFFKQLIEKQAIKLKKLKITTTYHDPCHAGRHMGLYDDPRYILRKISDFTEMKAIREGAHCCGAGGGVKKGYPALALEMAKNRVNEAEDTGAKYLTSICPFCYRNLSEAIETAHSKIKMVDLTELFLKVLEK
nr:(Fe-S)-binding protein [Candidatus Sigynarchaeota archaeon]